MTLNSSFEAFMQERPTYSEAYYRFEELQPILAHSARIVFEMHGNRLKKPVDQILGYLEIHEPTNYLDLYIERVSELMKMQQRFNREPILANLSDTNANVSREAYNVSLLLSILFSNHRFEIIDQLKNFLNMVRRPTGKVVSIGMGTGYELMLTARTLKGWELYGYDIDLATHEMARNLNKHFGTLESLTFKQEFPLNGPTPETKGRFEAIILCEVLEHLPDPVTALQTLKQCLHPNGYLFLTMAINIAQEDHIYLYPDIASCRKQITMCGLKPLFEWITPVTVQVLPQGKDREHNFYSGNYIAIVQ
ncbi:MAG: class I SAM-dependent methyltransferase [Crocosphaera sp.]|nr:class I SAM-dependent methyltransferase [Crocosphaera sp.]